MLKHAARDTRIWSDIDTILRGVFCAYHSDWGILGDQIDGEIAIIKDRFQNSLINDPIQRIARWPMSKLNAGERLSAPAVKLARACVGENPDPVFIKACRMIARGIAAAIAYDELDDREVMDLANRLGLLPGPLPVRFGPSDEQSIGRNLNLFLESHVGLAGDEFKELRKFIGEEFFVLIKQRNLMHEMPRLSGDLNWRQHVTVLAKDVYRIHYSGYIAGHSDEDEGRKKVRKQAQCDTGSIIPSTVLDDDEQRKLRPDFAEYLKTHSVMSCFNCRIKA